MEPDPLRVAREMFDALDFDSIIVPKERKTFSLSGVEFEVVAETPEAEVMTGEIPPGTFLEGHVHPQKELFVVTAGSMNVHLPSGDIELVAPATLWIPAYTPHSGIIGPDGASGIFILIPSRSNGNG